MTLMVTGHRKLVPAGYTGSPWPEASTIVANHHVKLHQTMFSVIQNFFNYGHKDFISGMAIGADMIFASAVLYGKLQNMPIRLIAAVPFVGQESRWPESSRVRYTKTLEAADIVKIVSDGAYTPAKMQIRNQWMVDNSDAILAVWDGAQSGGTYNCITYASRQNKQIIHLNSQTLIIKELK